MGQSSYGDCRRNDVAGITMGNSNASTFTWKTGRKHLLTRTHGVSIRLLDIAILSEPRSQKSDGTL